MARGSHAEVLAKDATFGVQEAALSDGIVEQDDMEDDSPEPEYTSDGKLVVEEVIAKGHISSRSCECSVRDESNCSMPTKLF